MLERLYNVHWKVKEQFLFTNSLLPLLILDATVSGWKGGCDFKECLGL